MTATYDVIIIGSGTAGLSALRQVRKQTNDFLLINDGSWGTTCASVGCMPSKTLIEAANAFHSRHAFAAFGLRGADGVTADIPAILARVRRLRDGFVKGPESVRDELGSQAISGRARLLGPGCVEVHGRELGARRIILATGSRPVVPADWHRFGSRILTTDTLFELTDLPRRIAVVGMGAIGVEIAQALSRLGVEVAGFDAAGQVAGIGDPEVAEAAATLLGCEFPLHLGATAELSETGGLITVSADGTNFAADAVLVAIGRRPNIDGLGLETLGVPLDDKGMPEVNRNTMQIGGLPVWLAGDANGDRAILHEAADEGYIAGRNAMAGEPASFCRRTALAIVFSSPGIARVGLSLADLDPESTVIGSTDFSRQSRARMAGHAEGLLRIYADRRTGRLLGAEMCVPAAEHMAHLLALALEQELTVHQMLAMPFYHPVLEEGLRGALRDITRQISGEDVSDLAHCPALGIEPLE